MMKHILKGSQGSEGETMMEQRKKKLFVLVDVLCVVVGTYSKLNSRFALVFVLAKS